MKHVKRTPFIIMLCLLSFFSCKPTDLIFPEELDALELAAVVQSMPEYQEYLNADKQANEALIQKLESLNKKDSQKLKALYEKYPTPEIFVNHAEPQDLALYQELTGMDLAEGNGNSNGRFRDFLFSLQLRATYSRNDLAQVLFPEEAPATTEKFFPSCESYCQYEAGRQQRLLYKQCIQAYPGDSNHEATCARKSEMAFRYYLTICINNCKKL